MNKADNLQRQLHQAKCLSALLNQGQVSYSDFQAIRQENDKNRKVSK